MLKLNQLIIIQLKISSSLHEDSINPVPENFKVSEGFGNFRLQSSVKDENVPLLLTQ